MTLKLFFLFSASKIIIQKPKQDIFCINIEKFTNL